MQRLAAVIGGLRCIPTSERPIEAVHAKIHHAGLGRHHHTEAFMSCVVRSPEQVARLEACRCELSHIAYLCSIPTNAQKACEAVGLLGHPAVVERLQQQLPTKHCRAHRDPIFGKVIYHGDAHSLYKAAPPEVEFYDDDDDDRHEDSGDHMRGAPVDGSGSGHGGAHGSSEHGHSSGSGAGASSGSSGLAPAGPTTGHGTSAGGSGNCEDQGGDDGGGGKGQLSKQRSILVRHHSSLELIKKYLMKHLHVRLKEERASYFSLKFSEGAITSLEAKLTPQNQGAGKDANRQIDLMTLATPGAMLDFSADGLSAETREEVVKFVRALRGAIFFRLIHQAPSRLKLHQVVGASGFIKSDSVITTHAVKNVVFSEQHVHLDIASRKFSTMNSLQSLALSLEAVDLKHLLTARAWTTEEAILYDIDYDKAGDCIPTLLKDIVPSFLKKLLESDPDGRAELAEDVRYSELFDLFLEFGFVREAYGQPLQVTPRGHQAFVTCSVVHKPIYVAAMRDSIPVSEYSVWELIVFLDSKKKDFTHIVKKASKHDKPFVPSDPASKIWYSRPGATQVTRSYLLALADGKKEVSHWRSSMYYDALLAGEEYVKKPRVSKFAFAAQDEEDWDAGEMACATVGKKGRSTRQKRAVGGGGAPLDYDSGTSESSEGSCSLSSSSSPPSSASATSSAKEDQEEDQPSDTGSMRSSHGRLGVAFGLCHMTRVWKGDIQVGWEMKCTHPDHQSPIACRKNLRLTGQGRSPQLTERMMKAWAAWGASVNNREEHKNIWKMVAKAVKKGTLPESIEPPRSYSNSESHMAKPSPMSFDGPPKKRRLSRKNTPQP